MPGEDTKIARRSGLHAGPHNGRQSQQEEPSYYNISHLKPPVWKWEIASYFFFGGVSGGAFALSRMAERFGGKKYASLRRAAAWVSFATILPAPPLLIHDLGDPKRFHHMLRQVKLSSPMSLGTWILTSFSGAATTAVLRELIDQYGSPSDRSALAKMRDASMLLICDVAGVPLSLLLIGYTGVLLSCTANPLWCKNEWIGPLFSASGVSTACGATHLAMVLAGTADEDSITALERIDTASHVAEIATIAGYLKKAGELATPLTKGKYKHHLWGSIGGILAAEVLKRLPLPKPAKRTAGVVASLLGLAAGYSLRWAFVHAGHDAANDPRLARRASRPASSALKN